MILAIRSWQDLAMTNKLITVGLLVLIGGAAMGRHSRIPIVIVLVCLGLAVFSAVSGVQIVTRKAEIPTSDSFDSWKEYHTGLSAQLWGVRSGLAIVVTGAAIGLYGLTRVLPGKAGSWRRRSAPALRPVVASRLPLR